MHMQVCMRGPETTKEARGACALSVTVNSPRYILTNPNSQRTRTRTSLCQNLWRESPLILCICTYVCHAQFCRELGAVCLFDSWYANSYISMKTYEGIRAERFIIRSVCCPREFAYSVYFIFFFLFSSLYIQIYDVSRADGAQQLHGCCAFDKLNAYVWYINNSFYFFLSRPIAITC